MIGKKEERRIRGKKKKRGVLPELGRGKGKKTRERWEQRKEGCTWVLGSCREGERNVKVREEEKRVVYKS